MPYIFIALVLVNFFAPFTFVFTNNTPGLNRSVASAASTCKFSESATTAFDPKGIQPSGWLKADHSTIARLNVHTTGCVGEKISGTIIEFEGIDSNVFAIPSQKIDSDDFFLDFIPGEKDCNSGKCLVGFHLAITRDGYTALDNTYDTDSADRLTYDCAASTCSDNVDWVLKSVSGLSQVIKFTYETYSSQSYVGVKGSGPENIYYQLSDSDNVAFTIYDSAGKTLSPASVGGSNPIVRTIKSYLYDQKTGQINYDVSFTGLSAGTTYGIKIQPSFDSSSLSSLNKPIDVSIATKNTAGQQIGPGPSSGNTTTLNQNQKDRDNLPACGFGIADNSTVTGCAAQILYYVLFVPTSYLFALAGTFFDYTFSYSVNDSSYRSAFVVQGWGIVRDFCNMFFIFVLLYVAFATILGLHGFSTKETIINVIIIGVLINFSLFAAQMIIDTSNILARVFYNSNTITITQGGANGVTDNTPGLALGSNGVLPLSAALVNKVNPQNLIINATSVGQIPDKGGQGSDDGISAGTFILVTLLATGINIVGFLTFLSVGLIFVARVIGLWLAMIFVPFTFFTYMVPSMQGIGMVGWKKWWPETISLAFLAPIFIFFLYLILKFLQVGLGVFDANGKTGLDFVIAIVLPFAFIMVLLNKAKGIAKSMSGEMGQMITNGVSAVGGAAIGLATGGAALAMRGTVGAVANRLQNNDTLNNLAAGKNASGTAERNTKGLNGLFSYGLQKAAIVGKKATVAGAKGSFDARQTGVASGLSSQLGLDLNKFTGAVGLGTKSGIGGYQNTQAQKIAKEEKFADSLGVDHAMEARVKEKVGAKKKELGEAEITRDKAKAKMAMAEVTNGKDSAEYKAAKKEHAEASANVQNIKHGATVYTKDATLVKERETLVNNAPKQPQPLATNATQAQKDTYEKENKAYQDHQTKLQNLDAKILSTQKETKVEGLSALEKDLDRVKTGRKREYYLYKRKQSGKIYDVKRDAEGNIKDFGHPGESGKKAAKQLMKEFAEGLATGGAAGAVVGSLAGPAGAAAGALGGGLFQAVRNVVTYDKNANTRVGESHNPKPESGEDKYKPGKADSHAPKPSGGGGGGGGGGGHH